MGQFVTKHEIKQEFGIGWTSQKTNRLNGTWIEGIHWVRLSSRAVRYNFQLIEDWLRNRGDPCAHQRAIDNYLATLLSNTSFKGGRSSSLGRKNSAAQLQ